MSSLFLSKDYIVLALIKAKYQIFEERFATTTEINQFISFMQEKFNEHELGVEIVYELNKKNFNVKNDVVTVNDRFWINLDILPTKILNILTDESLILEFFVKIETRRLEILKRFSKAPISAEVSANKMLTRVKY